MKNICQIIVILFLLCLPLQINAENVVLPPNFKEIHFELPENWDALKQKRKNIISFSHQNKIATLNIKHQVMSEIITANALKELRAKFTYNSWINVYERKGTEKENILSNVEDSYIAIYLSQNLDNSLNIIEHISGEYYYISKDKYYIITIETTKKNWKKIQESLKIVLNSFWIGDGEKPIYIPEENNDNEWERKGTSNNNNNFINAAPILKKPLSKQWAYTITNSKELYVDPLYVNNHIYLLDKEKLISLTTEGKERWKYSFTDDYEPFMSHKSGTLLLIKKDPVKEIVGIMANNGQILFKYPINHSEIKPIIINESILYIENGFLKSISRLTGAPQWEKEYNLNNAFQLTSKKQYLIGINSENKLLCIDSRNGDILWTYHTSIKSKFDPVIQNESVYIINNIGDTHSIVNISLTTGDHIWTYSNPLVNLKLLNTPSINKNMLIVLGEINSKTLVNKKVKNKLIIGLDIETKKIIWEKTISNLTIRPIITENLLYYISDEDTITILDTLSGKEIPVQFNEKKEEITKIKHMNVYKNSLFSFLYDNETLKLIAEK